MIYNVFDGTLNTKPCSIYLFRGSGSKDQVMSSLSVISQVK